MSGQWKMEEEGDETKDSREVGNRGTSWSIRLNGSVGVVSKALREV